MSTKKTLASFTGACIEEDTLNEIVILEMRSPIFNVRTNPLSATIMELELPIYVIEKIAKLYNNAGFSFQHRLDLNRPVPPEVMDFLNNNRFNKIGAIKMIRDKFKWGLRDSKDYFEHHFPI